MKKIEKELMFEEDRYIDENDVLRHIFKLNNLHLDKTSKFVASHAIIKPIEDLNKISKSVKIYDKYCNTILDIADITRDAYSIKNAELNLMSIINKLYSVNIYDKEQKDKLYDLVCDYYINNCDENKRSMISESEIMEYISSESRALSHVQHSKEKTLTKKIS